MSDREKLGRWTDIDPILLQLVGAIQVRSEDDRRVDRTSTRSDHTKRLAGTPELLLAWDSDVRGTPNITELGQSFPGP